VRSDGINAVREFRSGDLTYIYILRHLLSPRSMRRLNGKLAKRFMATQCRVLQLLRNLVNCVLCTYLILLDVHALVIACNISCCLSSASLSQPKVREWLNLGMLSSDYACLCE